MSSQESEDGENFLTPGPITRRQRRLAGQPVEEDIPLPSRTSSRRKTPSTSSVDSLASGSSAASVFSKQARRRVDSVASLSWDSSQEDKSPQFNSSRNYSVGQWDTGDRTFNITGDRSAISCTSSTNTPDFSGVSLCVERVRSDESVNQSVPNPWVDDDSEEEGEAEHEVAHQVEVVDRVVEGARSEAERATEQSEGSGSAFATPNSSLDTVVDVDKLINMEEITAKRMVLLTVGQMIDEDITPMKLTRVTKEFLETKCDEAEAEKVKLREASAYLMLHDQADYTANWAAKVDTCRKILSAFVNSAQDRLVEMQLERQATGRNATESALIASRAIKAAQVGAHYKTAVNDMKAIENKMKAFTILPGMDQTQFRKEEEEEKVLCKRADALKTDAQRIRTEAVDAGMGAEAAEVETGLREMQKQHVNLITKMSAERKSRNLTGSSSSGSIFRGTDITPPVFSGVHSDSNDFFKFERDLKEYIAVKNPSTEELVRVILTKCLRGEALYAVEHMRNKDDIMTYLRETYGVP